MKKLFLLAWPIALAAVSCSNEEVVSVNNDANEIKFTAVAENGTRAQNLFCNVNKPTTFQVWAAVDGAQYFANVKYVKEATSDTYKANPGEVHFWPADAVDFYAVTEEQAVKTGDTPDKAAVYYDLSSVFGWNKNTASTITWSTRSTDAPAQTDLLYAYTHKSREQATEDGTVGINFRHALSQIVFKAKNTNKTIDVTIDEVEVVNISNKGKFTMPFGNLGTKENPNWNVTDGNVQNHLTTGDYPDKGVGSWEITADAEKVKYTTTKFKDEHGNAREIHVDFGEAGVNLTEEDMTASTHSNFGHSLLLIPQSTTAWDKSAIPSGSTGTGSYFKVWCKIRNVASSDGNVADGDLYLWGKKVAEEGQPVKYVTVPVYIPFTANWKPGKKYIYTFTFNENTTGGYDEEGKPVLIPISFTVTVDDFVKIEEGGDKTVGDVNMQK